MATNFIEPGKVLSIPIVAGLASGDPYVLGNHVPGVVLNLIDIAGTDLFMDLSTEGVFMLSVRGHDGLGNVGISMGNPVYYNAAHTPVLDADDSGIFFGIALDDVGSGVTSTTCRVKLMGCCTVPDDGRS